MTFSEHCDESTRLFGKPWEEVHLWLDEFAGQPGFGMQHRRVRHHQAGLNEFCRLFGAEAVTVARQHIVSDLQQEGWQESDHFPRDEADYRRMGLF